MKIDQQAKRRAPQAQAFGKPVMPVQQEADGDAIMLEDDSDEGVEYDDEEDY